jgi:redox-sensing transcriptional repressor
MNENASKSTLKRLPFYLDLLKQKREQNIKNISSSQVAKELGLHDVQVRKDLATASKLGGKPKIGYEIDELIRDIEEYLGCYSLNKAVLVGVGSLGKALLGYKGFKSYGLEIVGAFDSYSGLIGNEIKGITIQSMDRLNSFIKENDIHIGIITVPVQYAEGVCEKLVNAGVQAIWNFAPIILKEKEGVIIQTENMASSLAVLSRHLESKKN